MEREVVYIVLIFNFFLSIFFYIKTGCEIPLFLSTFNLLVEYRTISLELGYSQWVNFDYEIYFVFNMENAYKISELILFGSSILIYFFILFYSKPRFKINDNNELLKAFVLSKRNLILIGLGLFSVFQLFLSGNISAGYGILSKLGNSSFIIFFFLLITFQESRNKALKMVFIVMFLGLAYITYSPVLRFQFLGWLVPVGFFAVRNIRPVPKLALAVAGLSFVLVVFSAAGVLREYTFESISWGKLYEESLDRLKIADDIGFIDGFIMIDQIYPRHLDHTNGMEHINILLRPIPRTIWPNKPLATWVQNYYAKHGKKGVWAAGFSPTLYGIFYSERGTIGILVFSVLWALFLSYIYRLTQQFDSYLRVILVGVILASLIPIFRSGDLAGDFSIVLMSYWPLFVFIRYYKKFVLKNMRYEE